jgi:hypothetical protein
MKSKRDELQTQAQQMQEAQHLLLVCFTSDMLLGIIGILAWGMGFMSQSAWVQLDKDDNFLKTI